MQNIVIQTQVFYWKKHIACRTGVFLLILGEPRKRGERDSRFALASAFAIRLKYETTSGSRVVACYPRHEPPKHSRIEWVASNQIPMLCVKNSGIVRGQVLWRKCIAKSLFRRPKQRFWGELNAFSPLFCRKWILERLIHGKCKLLFEKLWSMW